MTATRSAPASINVPPFSGVMPPIATMGMDNCQRASWSNASGACLASGWVLYGKNRPVQRIVAGYAEDRLWSEQGSGFLIRRVILTQMHAIGPDVPRQPGIVVDDERHPAAMAELTEGLSLPFTVLKSGCLVAVLDP